MPTTSQPGQEADEYLVLRKVLLEAYGMDEWDNPMQPPKKDILKEHEALQLALLQRELRQGKRSLMVTADNRLRRVTLSAKIGGLKDALISELGLVQLVDLLMGVDLDPVSLSRLIWSFSLFDEEAAVRNYLIDRAVQKYDEAIVLTMGEVLDDFVLRATKEARLERVSLLGRGKQRAKTLRFMDRVEGEFFDNVAEAVKKHKQDLDRSRDE